MLSLHMSLRTITCRQTNFFHPRASTQTVLSVTRVVLGPGRQQHAVLLFYIFFDLSKAFDSLSHSLVINALARVGICGNLLAWINDYLVESHQLYMCQGKKTLHRFLRGAGQCCLSVQITSSSYLRLWCSAVAPLRVNLSFQRMFSSQIHWATPLTRSFQTGQASFTNSVISHWNCLPEKNYFCSFF